MYGIFKFTYIQSIFMVNVGEYTMRGSYGYCYKVVFSKFPATSAAASLIYPRGPSIGSLTGAPRKC